MQKNPIRPDHIEVYNYNKSHPENMKIKIV
jgi:hypothetical protein